MEKSEILQLIEPFLNLDEDQIEYARFYAFKTKNIKDNINPHITLNYEFFDASVGNKDVHGAIDTILHFFKTKYIDNEEKIFSKYNINNNKDEVDYIELQGLNFQTTEILNGTDPTISSNSYKIEHFVNSMASVEIPVSKNDYTGWKYSVLSLKLKTEESDDNNSEEDSTIILINKAAPILSAKGNLYLLEDVDVTQKELKDYTRNLKPLDKKVIKLPYWPHIVIVNNMCFMVNENVESLFGFEQCNKRTAKDVSEELHKELMFSDDSMKEINSFVKSRKNHNLFANFDNTILKNIKANDKDTLAKLKTVTGITQNKDGVIEITNTIKAENFIAFICGHVKLDVITDKHEIAKNSTAMRKQ